MVSECTIRCRCRPGPGRRDGESRTSGERLSKGLVRVLEGQELRSSHGSLLTLPSEVLPMSYGREFGDGTYRDRSSTKAYEAFTRRSSWRVVEVLPVSSPGLSLYVNSSPEVSSLRSSSPEVVLVPLDSPRALLSRFSLGGHRVGAPSLSLTS